MCAPLSVNGSLFLQDYEEPLMFRLNEEDEEEDDPSQFDSGKDFVFLNGSEVTVFRYGLNFRACGASGCRSCFYAD